MGIGEWVLIISLFLVTSLCLVFALLYKLANEDCAMLENAMKKRTTRSEASQKAWVIRKRRLKEEKDRREKEAAKGPALPFDGKLVTLECTGCGITVEIIHPQTADTEQDRKNFYSVAHSLEWSESTEGWRCKPCWNTDYSLE